MLLSVNFLAVTNSFILVNCEKCIFRILKILFTADFVIYYYKMCFHSFIHSCLWSTRFTRCSPFWFLDPFKYLLVQFSFCLLAGNTCIHGSIHVFPIIYLYMPDRYGLICFCIAKTSVLFFCRNSFFGFCLDIFECDAYLAVDHNLVCITKNLP